HQSGANVIHGGTGSALLALAGVALRAPGPFRFDNDPDAIAAARENLMHNPALADNVVFFLADLRTVQYEDANHVVTANLTAPLLIESASTLACAISSGRHIILSGLLTDERDAVLAAFGESVKKVWQADEDGWTGLILVKN